MKIVVNLAVTVVVFLAFCVLIYLLAIFKWLALLLMGSTLFWLSYTIVSDVMKRRSCC